MLIEQRQREGDWGKKFMRKAISQESLSKVEAHIGYGHPWKWDFEEAIGN